MIDPALLHWEHMAEWNSEWSEETETQVKYSTNLSTIYPVSRSMGGGEQCGNRPVWGCGITYHGFVQEGGRCQSLGNDSCHQGVLTPHTKIQRYWNVVICFAHVL